jgi:hypothetical protein
MRRMFIMVLLVGWCVASYATDARVSAMGRHDDFFMDEVSIFRNPANINIYPNMVYGSYGVYRPSSDTAAQRNSEPINPFFGAIVSYSLNQKSEDRSQYPMFSVGAVFNRQDEMLDYITPSSDKYIGDPKDRLVLPTGKVDLLFGYVLKNGGMIGVGSYFAFQSMTKKDKVEQENSCYKGTLGINWPVAKSTNLEISLGGGILRAMGDSGIGSASRSKIMANNDWFAKADIRFFSALSILNGDFVPHFGVQRINLYSEDVVLTDLAAGLGLNIHIDKGFFWAGIEGLYKNGSYFSDSTKSGIGGRVSFGIERSIWWDWFVIRVGGQKAILYTSTDSSNVTKGRWNENSPSDGSDNDLVALGFGLNVENRLRVDFVASENVPYTFNFFSSSPQHHLFTRISATYSF